ncbi:sulfite exporter TauE/SafE family protein [Thalassotalea sp. PLHSN55]|uniref:sulfite exporter TauE/SafE family protein n=1 Tax=Thalassotalea sp. PLHSN55 TaxID=3435888 RepID=UPI003F86DC6E
MDIVINLLPFAGVMLITGIVAGILAGLLGIGGGIVIVPVLELGLGFYGVEPSVRMHVAIGTSLACIILTSISSTKAHYGKGNVDVGLVKAWGPVIVIGSLVGTLGASYLNSQVLAAIFAIVILIVALKMLLPLDKITLSKGVPRGIAAPVAPFIIGSLSSMMGIGGGSLTVPTLTLMNQQIHKAVGTAAVFGLFISIPGAIGFVVSGLSVDTLPLGSIGYVNIIGLALIAPMSIIAAPFGVKLAQRLTKRQLSTFFGSFLLLVAIRMIYRTFIA